MTLLATTNHGRMVLTRGVNDKVAEDIRFSLFVLTSLRRHMSNDWGCVCAEDKASNDAALQNGEERLFSAYEHATLPKIWIITEADRTATTVLFPEEY